MSEPHFNIQRRINEATYHHYVKEGIKLDNPIYATKPPVFVDSKGKVLPEAEQRSRLQAPGVDSPSLKPSAA